ncbi:MAG TPA: SdrD B-like domain-containing protein [Gemmataceae bacterium]|jgi:hypothetical protein|nr:SdrD B-like domain-containing protein [Gemmataceae bacterium]
MSSIFHRFARLFTNAQRRPFKKNAKGRTFAPLLETLEDRCLLSTLVNHFDTNGQGQPETDSIGPTIFAGQFMVHVDQTNGPTVASPSSPEFLTLCADPNFNDTVVPPTFFAVNPEPTSVLLHGGEVAYLYNHFGTTAFNLGTPTLNNDHATALQIAIWELITDNTPDLTMGAYRYGLQPDGSNTDASNPDEPNILLYANQFLGLAAGQNESAIYLAPSAGSGQGMLAPLAIVTTPGTTVPLGGFTIGGTKYQDLTGNGFSADDTPQSGVTINLYRESNNTKGLQVGGDTFVTSTTTGADGTYSFALTTPGTYYVQESVPPGYIQTGGGSGGSAGCTYFTVVASSGHAYGGNNFDDFMIPTCTPICVSYKVTTPSNCSQTVTDLGGNTLQGDTVTVTFTVPPGMNDQLTLVSYYAPGSSFSNSTANQQAIYQQATGIFTPGVHTLTVQIPNCFYQIDFVCGTAISQLEPNQNGNAYGPDSANILYHAEQRFISSDNGGTTPCNPKWVPPQTLPPMQTVTSLPGMNLTDSATLSGGFNPTGTITFYLFAPGVTPLADNSNNVYSDTVTVTGDGTYTTSMGTNPGGYPPTIPGTYQWVAVYGGDPNNIGITSPFGSEPEVVTGGGSISGTKYNDLSGNGFLPSGGSADPALPGGASGTPVTINLYLESNNQSGLQNTGLNSDTLVAQTTTDASGNFSFGNLPAGTYYVQEIAPSGWLQTGGGPKTTADGNTYYTVTVTGTNDSHGANNFDDFHEICKTSEFTNICYTVVDCYGHVTHPSSLNGNVSQGSTVTVNFTWNGTDTGDNATLVSYIAPNGNFNTSNLQGQVIFQQSTVALKPGKTHYSLTVTVPNCYFQLDFVCGLAIDHLATNPNVYYHAQQRFIDGTQGGCQVCAPSCISGKVFADCNNDGVQQWGEQGIQGVTITLTGHDYTGALVSLTTTTDSNGQYSFGNLLASDANGYTITESQPAGYTHEGQSAGSTGGVTGDHTITTFLNTNTSSTGNNFAEFAPVRKKWSW